MANRLQPDVNATPVVIVDAVTGLPSGGSGSTSNVQGDVAAGSTDSGNPVKVGGIARDTAPTAVANGQRTNAWYGRNGQQATLIVDGAGNIVKVQTANAAAFGADDYAVSTRGINYNYDGATFWLQKGDSNGLFNQGNIANGVAESGNPLLVGGTANTSFPSAVNPGARARAWFNQNGAQMAASVTANAPADATTGANFGAFLSNAANTSVFPMVGGFVYNGNTFDRLRGDTSGLYLAANANFVESTTALAANGSITGAARNVGSRDRFSFYLADAYADTAGTLFVERSVDGTTWRPANGTTGQAVAAGASVIVKLPISSQFYRARYVNGGTAQGAFLLTTAFSLN